MAKAIIPFQLMRDMMLEPFRGMSLLGRDLGLHPSFDVRETDDAFVLKGDMPGIRDQELEVTVTGSQLEISGKHEQEQEARDGQLHTHEGAYGSFTGTFTLPDSADTGHISSELADGVLTLVVPKKPT